MAWRATAYGNVAVGPLLSFFLFFLGDRIRECADGAAQHLAHISEVLVRGGTLTFPYALALQRPPPSRPAGHAPTSSAIPGYFTQEFSWIFYPEKVRRAAYPPTHLQPSRNFPGYFTQEK